MGPAQRPAASRASGGTLVPGEQAGQQEIISVWVLLSVLGTARAGSAHRLLSDQLGGDGWGAPGVHSELLAPAWG